MLCISVGQSCTLRSTGANGICKLSCRVAEEEAKRGIRPTLCGYIQETPIICCEGKNLINNTKHSDK